MRICLDLDGVICQLKKNIFDNYEFLEPVDGAIEKIQSLKSAGHYIIIFTARRMKTHQGNLGKVIADIGLIKIDWLKKYQIPYDEIYFGKPWADIYVDDNAMRFHAWHEIDSCGTNLFASKESVIDKC